MGVFDDKRYEELDWISKAVEPIEGYMPAILENLPDEVSFDYQRMEHEFREGHILFDISVGQIVRSEIGLLSDLKPELFSKIGSLHYEELSLLEACYELEISDDCIINLTDKTMTGSVVLKKVKTAFADEDLQGILGSRGKRTIGRLSGIATDAHRERLNEMLDMLGNARPEDLKTRSVNYKSTAVRDCFSNIMLHNRWNIRNMELADRIGTWIFSYVERGNLAALANLAKLKVMTHKGLPIYSIQEEL